MGIHGYLVKPLEPENIAAKILKGYMELNRDKANEALKKLTTALSETGET